VDPEILASAQAEVEALLRDNAESNAAKADEELAAEPKDG